METELLVNGEKAFDKIFQEISRAEKSLVIHMFIWRDDVIGVKLATHVLEAANRGIEVTIVKDLLGGIFEHAEEKKQSFFHESLPVILKIKSVVIDKLYPMKGKEKNRKKVCSPLATSIRSHPNITVEDKKVLKDHSKYYIIDNRILILGGINVEDKEVTHDVEGKRYHDYMMFFYYENVVRDFLTAQTTGGDVLRRIIDKDEHVRGQIDFIANTKVKKQSRYYVKSGILSRLEQTQNNLHIVMAYIGDNDVMDAIVRQAKRGVKVNLYLPGKANLQNDLNLYHLKRLMKSCNNQISVFLCQDMIHAKLIWIDEDYVTFGSTNLNKQALNQLRETNIGCFLKKHGQDHKLRESIQIIVSRSVAIFSWKQIHFNPVKAWLERTF